MSALFPSPLASAGELHVVTGDWMSWLILFLPLAAAALIQVLPALRRNGRLAAYVAIASVGASLAITLFGYFIPAMVDGMAVHEGIVPWIHSGRMELGFGVRIDQLALTMTLVVTAVGFAIFVYALGYMHGDESMGRFYAKFALFVFSMLGIVLSPNFFQTFVFWELVGASSYLLIGYYWKKHSAGEAAKKAFMTNRVGDFGFLLGILVVWTAAGNLTGTLDFDALRTLMTDGSGYTSEVLFGGAAIAAVAGILVFAGAMGKSAQFPLHVWLPDAMEGPTPVSALMHAATMVAAGVFMITRCFFLFEDTAWAPTAIAWIGGITAFLSATMAIAQNDIKKVLAYSTLSQLGYMMMALGAGAYSAAMFHLTTHAFFKALLFLCAGSVINGCHHEQDMLKMGGLNRVMPATYRTFVIGTLALCGIFPFAGFWSKDEILGSMLHADGVTGHTALFVIGLISAGLTAFYMGRVWWLTFKGDYRGHATPHESPKVMTLPLWGLAFFAVVIGFVGIPGAQNRFEHFLHTWAPHAHGAMNFTVAIVSIVVALGGLLLARAIYSKAEPGTDPLPARLGGLWTLWHRLYYIDDFYLWLVRKVQDGIAWLAWQFERWVIIGALVNGTAYLVRLGGDRVRRIQAGQITGYVTVFALGAVILASLVLLMSCNGGRAM